MPQTIKIEKMAYGGEGIGYLDGKVCFVSGALPRETVEVQIVQEKKNFLRGEMLQILEASSLRTEAPCPYIKTCGGCQYQHVEYSEELKWKEIQVREYLARNLKIQENLVGPIQGASQPYHYRNSVTVHRTESGKSGFFSEDNESITPIETCLLADERLDPAFRASWTGSESKRTFRLSAEGELVSDQTDKIFPVSLGKKIIYTMPKSFFQNNLEITEKIGTVLAAWVKQIQPETFVDLYSGVGTFSVLAAHGVKKVICVEENGYSQSALKMNLEYLGIPYEILADSVEKTFPNYFSRQPLQRPFVFMDPARVGMASRISSFLARQKSVEAYAYLSCHLGTLTRDLGIILKEGIFEIAEVIPFDMFPRTKHIEILTLLRKK